MFTHLAGARNGERQAAARESNDEVTVLDLAEPVKLVDLGSRRHAVAGNAQRGSQSTLPPGRSRAGPDPQPAGHRELDLLEERRGCGSQPARRGRPVGRVRVRPHRLDTQGSAGGPDRRGRPAAARERPASSTIRCSTGRRSATPSPGIRTAGPDVIDASARPSRSVRARTTVELSRLQQYRMLEQKLVDRQQAPTSNEEFLRSCDIRIAVLEGAEVRGGGRALLRAGAAHQPAQLHQAPPQSARTSPTLLTDPGHRVGCVRVRDRYGDYGICGFFAMRRTRRGTWSTSCSPVASSTWVSSNGSTSTLAARRSTWWGRWCRTSTARSTGSRSRTLPSVGDAASLGPRPTGCWQAQSTRGPHGRRLRPHHRGAVLGRDDRHPLLPRRPDRCLHLHRPHGDASAVAPGSRRRSGRSGRPDPLPRPGRVPSPAVVSPDYDVLVYSVLTDYTQGLYRHRTSGLVVPWLQFDRGCHRPRAVAAGSRSAMPVSRWTGLLRVVRRRVRVPRRDHRRAVPGQHPVAGRHHPPRRRS